MSTRSLTWLAVIFVLGFALIGIGHCGYDSLSWMQSLDAASEHIEDKFDDVDHISTDTLAALLEGDPQRKKVLLIDARTDAEYAVSRIPGAIHAPDTDAIAAAIAGLPERPSTLITYCSIGYRSAELAEAVEHDERIRIPIKNVLGSIFQWANEKRPLETPQGETTTRVHPFNKTWGRLLEGADRD